jgi:hypothetical protein
MLTNMSVKMLQEQDNDKASPCHKVSVNQKLMPTTRVNINTTSVCHFHGSVQTVGSEEQATETTVGSQV